MSDHLYGIEQSRKLVAELADLINIIFRAMAEFKNSTGIFAKLRAIGVLMDLAGVLAVMSTFKITDFVNEVREYDTDEQDELKDVFYSTLRLADNDAEALIEAIFGTILKGQDLIQGIINMLRPKVVRPVG